MALFRRLSGLGSLGALTLVLVALQLPLTAGAVDGGSGTPAASRGDLPVVGVLDGRGSGAVARSGVGSSAAGGESFSCTSTGLGGSGQPSYSADTPGMLTGIVWSGTGTSGCTVAASISSTVSAIDPQGSSHPIAEGNCAGCTSTSVTSAGYTCQQGSNGGMNCAGAWQLTFAVTYQVSSDKTFTSADPGCTAAGSTLSCTQSTPAGSVLLFNSPVLPACPATATAASLAHMLAAASTSACYNLPPGDGLPVLWERNLQEIRDSHFPGGRKVDSSKSLFHPNISNNDLQTILEAGLKDSSPWTDSSSGLYFQKTFPYSGVGDRSDGYPATNIVILVSVDVENAYNTVEVINMYPA
jgi:hypothetical protein